MVQAKLGLVFEEPEEEGEVDMCKGMEMVINSERKDERESTLLQTARNMMKNLHLTVEQVFAAMEVPLADQPRLAGML